MRALTMNIFLGDAVGPDERGQPADISFKHTFVNGKLQMLTGQDYWVLIVVVDHCAH